MNVAGLVLLTLPGLGLVMAVLAAVELTLRWLGKRGLVPWLRHRTGRSLSATAFDEYSTVFQGSKRIELDHRDEAQMLGEDEESGDPPWTKIDLYNGTARIPQHATQPPPRR